MNRIQNGTISAAEDSRNEAFPAMSDSRNDTVHAMTGSKKETGTNRKFRSLFLVICAFVIASLLLSMSYTRVSGLTSELFAAGITEDCCVIMATDPCYNVNADVKMVKGGAAVFKSAVSLLRTPSEPETEKNTGEPVRLNKNGVPVSGKTVPGNIRFNADGSPVNYSRVFHGKATAYSNDTVTSTGTKPVQGSVAVNPAVIPYGTEMWIVSSDGQYVYGYCKAEDTGGFIYLDNGPDVDLFFENESDCEEWGVRDVTIYIF